VPETDKVKMNPETGTMVRSGLESIINPLDLYAIEEALLLKEKYGAQVTAITMGPPDAERALREALAMGCDEAILLTDKAFAGSDTWATSRVLAAAIQHIGDVDLILAGERATDGDTGQVGPEVASWLGIAVLTYASSLEIEFPPMNSAENKIKPTAVQARRLVEEGYQVVHSPTPCLITVVKEIASPRLPTLRGKKYARTAQIMCWEANDLGLDPSSIGLAGSPTRVVKIFYPKVTRNGKRIVANDEKSINDAIDEIIAIFEDKGIIRISAATTALSFTTSDSPSTIGPSLKSALLLPSTSTPDLSTLQTVEAEKDCTKPEFWIIAERHSDRLDSVSYELLARARYLTDKRGAILVAIVLAPCVPDEEARALISYGADRVIALEDPCLQDFVCETWADVLIQLIQTRKPEVILGAATTTGRTLMPYLAARIGTGLTADCTELSIEKDTGLLLQTRPAIGGNIMATIKTAHHKPQMATVRPHSTRPLCPDLQRKGNVIRLRSDLLSDKEKINQYARVLSLERNVKDFENLEGARMVVAGGRGLRKAENFKLIRDLASIVGGVVGASRDSVDRGWISYPHQVGLSGKTISPEVYFCAGISGAIQHLAGIRTAKTIISINIDPEAPIHAVADLAIVGDLFELLPQLTARLQKIKTSSAYCEAGK